MYAGHAALALVAKARRTRLPLALLVVVAYAPDWVEWVMGGSHHREAASSWPALASHSLPSVLLGSVVVAVLGLAVWRDAWDAAALAALYLSHWLADLITGLKPTWAGGPMVGLRLYEHELGDFALESVLILACWLYYRRSLPPGASRRWSALIPVGLIVLQAGFGLLVRQMG